MSSVIKIGHFGFWFHNKTHYSVSYDKHDCNKMLSIFVRIIRRPQCTYSLGLARTGGGALCDGYMSPWVLDPSSLSSSSSSSSSSGSLKCTRRPTREADRGSLWLTRTPSGLDLRQEAGGSGRGTVHVDSGVLAEAPSV